MARSCPSCFASFDIQTQHPLIVRTGSFYRKSDSRRIQRFCCKRCHKHFSLATSHPCFAQHKRQMNEPVRRLFCSGVSQRRMAILLHLNQKTVVRKLIFLGLLAENFLAQMNKNRPKATIVEFDDMETFEHTKCKPLSITLAVESKSRHILGFEVSVMPAKGRLAEISRKKYGPRPDQRSLARKRLFQRIKGFTLSQALIKSDENPHYKADVKRFFPDSVHEKHKGRRGCIVGQGELKKIGFDPLFSLNHTCAKLRADINRLFRRTWCTTKRADRLVAHLMIYAVFHNQSLKVG